MLYLVPQLRKLFGITRLADITRLDRLGIPNVAAIVPRSPDFISVYSGKGLSRCDAVVGAVMEAVERQACARAELPYVLQRPSRVRGIDLRALGVQKDCWDEKIAFVEGVDLLDNRLVLVPYASVKCPWTGPSPFGVISTNGLAAGSSRDEAILHALYELIERHIWAIVHARSHVIFQVLFNRLAEAGGIRQSAEGFVDSANASEIAFPTGDAELDSLFSSAIGSGLRIRLLAIQEGPFPTVMVANLSEGGESVRCNGGYGCSWSPRDAALSAVLEAIQSRMVDIQGAREDARRFGEHSHNFASHGRRVASLPHGRWYYDAPMPFIELDILRCEGSSIEERLQLTLSALRSLAPSAVACIDIPTDSEVHVVRIVIPEIETGMIDGRIGPTIAAQLSTQSII